MIIRNGIELRYVEQFELWVEKLKQEFARQKEYSGFPMLPECWLEGMELYRKGSDIEKEYMMSCIMTQFTEALRHWVVDKDALYPHDKNPYPPEDIRHYMKQGWEKFWY